MNEIDPGPFTVADFADVATLSIEAWNSVPDADWGSLAAGLEWSRFETADHTIDCVFSYAFFLASRAQASYPSSERSTRWPARRRVTSLTVFAL